MKTLLRKYAVWILLLASIVSRLPQLFSDYLIMDCDECIVGLMAKHLYEGKEIPLYFYGQSYGFSFIELVMIIIFYFFFGISALSVKLAMLSLWFIGVLFFYKALRRITPPDSFTPLLISLVLVTSPAWAIWSMMARGGYLTAFTLCNLCLFMTLRSDKPFSFFSCVIPGVLCTLVYEGHALWIPGLIPVLLYWLWLQKKIKAVLYFGLGLFSTALLFYFLKAELSSFWPKPVTYFTDDILNVLKEMPEQVFNTMTGSYYYKAMIDLGPPNAILAFLFTLLVFSAPLFALYFFLRKRRQVLAYVLAVSVLFCLLSLFFIPDHAPRYLLPLCGFTLLLVAPLVEQIRRKWLYITFFVPFIILGSWSLFNFKNYRGEAQSGETLLTLSDWLVSKKIRHVFCRGALLQWQISFYSKERVIARYTASTDRYPDYIHRANTAFNLAKPVAMVDFYYFGPIEQGPHKILIAGNYVVDPDPSYQSLIEQGFDPRAK